MFPETCYLQGSKKDYDEFNGEIKTIRGEMKIIESHNIRRNSGKERIGIDKLESNI